MANWFNLWSKPELGPIEKSLGYQFKNKRQLNKALTHKSFQNEGGDKKGGNNERLEFLGDAILDFVISDLLMKSFPRDPEGSLSKKRASLVNEDHLSQMAKDMGIPDELRLGKGETKTGGNNNPRLLASALEAIIGAIYQDSNIKKTYEIVSNMFEQSLVDIGSSPDYASDYKTRLQERVQKSLHKTPVYELIEETGPDHEKSFLVSVSVDGKVLAQGKGRSKKNAEQNAARKAMETIK